MVKVSRIRFGKKNLGILSPLEMDVLNALWSSDGGYRVRDVYSKLSRKRKVALTSVAVILDRLHEKDIVRRTAKSGRGGYHYIYFTKANKKDFQQSIVERTVDKLIDSYGSVAVTYFNERFSKKRK